MSDEINTDLVVRDGMPDAAETQLEMFEKSFQYQEGVTMEDLAFALGEDLGGVGIRQALQVAALMACCDVIAQDISKAQLQLRERLPNGTSKIVLPSVRKNDIAEFLALEPNDFMTWREAIQMMVYWSCFSDNAYAGIIRNNDGSPAAMIPFQTGRVKMKVTGREVFYDVTAATLYEQALLGSSYRTFPARDMVHVRTRFLDGMEGYGTLSAGRSTIDSINAITRYSRDLFSEDGQTRGIFTTEKEGELPEPAFQRLRSQMRALMNKFRKLTEPIILEHGLKFMPISSKPNEIELTKQFEAAVNEICRLFRMPPHKVFMMAGSKYENLETQEKMYVGDTLEPRAKAFEDQFAKVMLERKKRLSQFFMFNRADMTLRDTKLETERAVQALERSGCEIDEFRAVFGWQPLPNDAGKVRLVPVNMVLVNDKNEVVLGSAASSSGSSDGGDPPADSGDGADNAGNGTKQADLIRLIKS